MQLPGKGRLAVVGACLVALAISVGLGVATGIATKKKAKGFPRGPYPTLGDCPVFPQSNLPANAPSAADQTAWNQNISQAPLAPNSASMIAYINSQGETNISPSFGPSREAGLPYVVTGKRQKRTKVNFLAYGAESTRKGYRVPLKALIEFGTDHHVLSIDRKRCKLQELYRAVPQKTPRPHWDADSGVIWNMRSAGLRTPGYTSADAAGLPIFPGLARYDDVQRGEIKHALRVSFASTRNAWLNPAAHCAGDTSSPDAPPMGTRLRLNAGYPINDLTGSARIIATALKRYGLIVADNGGNWFITGTTDRRWDEGNLNQLTQIPGSAFEVVRSAAPVHVC